MTSIPQTETDDPIPIQRETMALIRKVRAYQLTYRVRKDGPVMPKLRLMEQDLDKALASLPYCGPSWDAVEITQADVEVLLKMRSEQVQALRRKDYDDREMRTAQRAVDAMLASHRMPVPQPVAAVAEVEAAPAGWMPYRDD